MSNTQLSLLSATLLDNAGDRVVEFDAEGSGEVYPFAVSYRVLEALSAVVPDADPDPVALVLRLQQPIARAAVKALARGPGIGRVTINEGDLV